nr:polyprenyl synthetase family protein [Propionibacterium sp.]
MVTLDVTQPVSPEFRSAVGAAIGRFLAERSAFLREQVAPELAALADRAAAFTAGGKRLRPAFCAWGHAACADSLDLPDAVLAAAASLDVLHVSALVHDDVMDASDTRRGLPAAHRQFEADHRARGGRGEPEAFGRAGAILLGDLLLVWSAEMFENAGLAPATLAAAAPWLQTVRTEVTAGQYLDVLAQAVDPYTRTRTEAGVAELERLVSRVVTFKSASYTVERPLHIGAALAGTTPERQATFTAYGRPLGRAFQYRDDLLGVFGDAGLTGKESGEDLREGKLTLLAVKTFAGASDAAAREFAALFGAADLDAELVDRAREIIVDSGAQADVEAAIEREYAAALAALDVAPWLGDAARAGLANLATAAVRRAF